MKRRVLISFLGIVAIATLAGCGSPNPANIALRKQNQKLESKVTALDRQHTGDVASIVAMEKQNPAVQHLSPQRLSKLFTVHGLQLGMLTGGDNPDPTAKSDSELMIYAVPTDDDGNPIKAAGSFKVQTYDLADPKHPLLGQWNFSTSQVRKDFYAHLSLYTYVLPCPWQTVPRHKKLTVRVSFRDELTGRTFSAERVATVRPPVPAR